MPTRASLVVQMVKHLPTMQETRVRSLDRKDPLEEEKVTHSSTVAWKIPWMEDPDRLRVNGVAKSRTRLSAFTFTFTLRYLEIILEEPCRICSNF